MESVHWRHDDALRKPRHRKRGVRTSALEIL
jgi:hypothetical protein